MCHAITYYRHRGLSLVVIMALQCNYISSYSFAARPHVGSALHKVLHLTERITTFSQSELHKLGNRSSSKPEKDSPQPYKLTFLFFLFLSLVLCLLMYHSVSLSFPSLSYMYIPAPTGGSESRMYSPFLLLHPTLHLTLLFFSPSVCLHPPPIPLVVFLLVLFFWRYRCVLLLIAFTGNTINLQIQERENSLC